jgi:hypothetical protein
LCERVQRKAQQKVVDGIERMRVEKESRITSALQPRREHLLQEIEQCNSNAAAGEGACGACFRVPGRRRAGVSACHVCG